jgi:hypothetical protein
VKEKYDRVDVQTRSISVRQYQLEEEHKVLLPCLCGDSSVDMVALCGAR